MVAPLYRQTWTVSAVLLNMIGQGMMMAHTTSLLPALRDPASSINADLSTASILASSCGLAGIPGFLISSVLMDIYGRRLTHLLMILPAIIGWLAIYFAQNIFALMIGRILGGFAIGATVLLGATAIAEYSDPKYRGVFLNLKTVAFGSGGMFVHFLSHTLSWRTIALCAVFPHIVSIIITFTWCESPAWLASKGKFDDSRKSFFWLRSNTESTNDELNKLISAQTVRLSNQKVNQSLATKFVTFVSKFKRKDFIKPSFIMLVSVVLLEASGRHFFPAYALQIIDEVSGSKSQSFYYTIFIDIIITVSAIFSSILVKIVNRRVLLFTTGFAACVVLMITCAYITLTANKIISNEHSWVAITLFAIFLILASLGCSPIPLALLGEVFPLPHREVGSSVSGMWMSLCLMLTLHITPQLLESVKVHGTLFVYAIVMGLALMILYYVLPETKDRTLQEIEDYFNHGKYKDDVRNKEEARNMMKEQEL